MLAVAAACLALVGVVAGPRRTLALAAALVAVGWWWGSVRLVHLDRSELTREVGRSGFARLEVTGPARRGTFALRIPVRVREFDRAPVSERALLELPPKRAPPQGAVLEAVIAVSRPRGDEGTGFDEAAYLRRLGVHVVLHAGGFRIVGRRGGLGGLADRLRGRIARTMAPGVSGERRAVIAGVVLGEDEGLSRELRARFRASGLYHLLRVA